MASALYTALFSLCLGTIEGLRRSSKPPHVLLIVADDFGWNDVGYHQNQKSSANPNGEPTTNGVISTPVLDQLAREGRTLEMYYVQPLCSPTRGTIMTGRYPSHTGIGPSVIEVSHAYGMPGSEVFIAQKFKSVNYSTHIVGKWHLGFCDERFTPTFRGFDSFIGYLGGMEDYWNHTRTADGFSGLDFRNSTTIRDSANKLAPADSSHQGTYSVDVLTKQVDLIVSTHDPKIPLFMYVPFQSVHAPLQAPQKYIDMYKSISDMNRRIYAGMVTALDDAVGSIRDSYMQKGLWNDTLLVFTTDNGGPPGSANNFPLRGHKATAWEGGVRGIAFVRGTNNKDLFPVPAGTSTSQLMHSSDWLPTLASVAGYSTKGLQLDGHDQWGVIARGENTTRVTVVHNCAAADFPRRAGAMRIGRYKLMFEDASMQVTGNMKQTPPPGFDPKQSSVCSPPKPTDDGVYLFDIIADPHECTNLAKSQPKVLNATMTVYDNYKKTAVADLALSHPKSDPTSNPQLRKDKAWGPFQGSKECKF